MNVVDVGRIFPLVPNRMFPKSPLPDGAFPLPRRPDYPLRLACDPSGKSRRDLAYAQKNPQKLFKQGQACGFACGGVLEHALRSLTEMVRGRRHQPGLAGDRGDREQCWALQQDVDRGTERYLCALRQRKRFPGYHYGRLP